MVTALSAVQSTSHISLSAVQSTSHISNIESDPLIKELVTTKQTEEDKVLPNYILLQICTLILFHSEQENSVACS